MRKYCSFFILLTLVGCHSIPQKQDAIAPIGNVPQYKSSDYSGVKGEAGKILPSSRDTPACSEYRGMMTAPMDPTAMKALKEKCEQSLGDVHQKTE